jgi:hypothetical protein
VTKLIGRKALGTVCLVIATFLNPFGFDILVYKLTQLTNDYWNTMFILYGLASVSFLLSYAFFRLAKRNIGNILITLGMFLNPLGYDIVVYGITQVTHSYWMTMSFMYMLAIVFFGLFIYLNQLNPIKHAHNKIKTNYYKMRKTFDELYSEFLNKSLDIYKKKAEQPKPQESDIIMNMLTDAEGLDKYITNLGKPNKIEFYNEADVFFEKRTWHTPHGDVVKIIVSDDPFMNISHLPKKSLEEKLADAVADEDYEKAAIIRDKIKNDKKNEK